MLVLSLLGMID